MASLAPLSHGLLTVENILLPQNMEKVRKPTQRVMNHILVYFQRNPTALPSYKTVADSSYAKEFRMTCKTSKKACKRQLRQHYNNALRLLAQQTLDTQIQQLAMAKLSLGNTKFQVRINQKGYHNICRVCSSNLLLFFNQGCLPCIHC